MENSSTVWQLPTYVTLGVIGGGMAVGLLVICVVCGCCSIFNRNYDRQQLKKRKVSIQATAVHSTAASPNIRKYSALPPRPILVGRKASTTPTTPGRSDLLESGQLMRPASLVDVDEEKARRNAAGVAVSSMTPCGTWKNIDILPTLSWTFFYPFSLIHSCPVRTLGGHIFEYRCSPVFGLPVSDHFASAHRSVDLSRGPWLFLASIAAYTRRNI